MSGGRGPWQTVSLGEIATIESGGTPSTDVAAFWVPEIDWVTAKDVSECSLAKLHETERRISNAGLKASPAKILPGLTTVLIARGATMGKCRMLARPMAMNQTCYGIVANESTDPVFLYYCLSNLYEYFRSMAHGSVFDTVIRSGLTSLTLSVPPLPTQRRIAEILGRLDDKIEVNRRINRTLEAMARALYRHWFVDFGPFRDGEFVESELGLVPKGWEVVRLEDVAKTNQLSIQNGHEPDRITYVDISSVSAGAIDSLAPMAFASAPSRARRLVRHGDTIWSAVRPNRRSFCLIQHPREDLVVSTGFVVLSPVKVPYSFLYCLLATKEFTDYLDARATGAAYPAVRPDDFEEALLVLPSRQVLSDFHQHVEPWLEQRYVLEREIRQLATARDYLLPKLLSGEVEVAVHE